jgi:hypothetical protein
MTVGKIDKQSRSSQDEKTRKGRKRPESSARKSKVGFGELKQRYGPFTPVTVTENHGKVAIPGNGRREWDKPEKRRCSIMLALCEKTMLRSSEIR